jgi:hypothetical protein
LFTQFGAQQVASVGDLVVLNGKQFLVLTRDGNGRDASVTASVFRAVVLYDLNGATNIAGTAYDTVATAVAPNGVLAAAVTPATSTVLVDINDLSQLTKFGLNNSASDNSNTLADKWESMALAPALDPAAPDDYFLFIGNDNDFTTTDGYMDGGSFKASQNTDSMILVYRLTLGSRLINISSRSLTGTGGDAHIAGFVVQGARAKTFLVRGVGPGLAAFVRAGHAAGSGVEDFRQREPPDPEQRAIGVTVGCWLTCGRRRRRWEPSRCPRAARMRRFTFRSIRGLTRFR